ncbi:MAG: aldehyde dehydrogenase family protein [Spirochaetota bacterium]
MAVIANPANGTPIAERQEHTAHDALRAAGLARAAQAEWAATPVRARAAVVRRVASWVVDHADELARLVSDSTGKPRVDALSTEVLPAVIMSDYYARNAARFLRPERLRSSSVLFVNKRSTLHREPFGLVGIISPWNYPLGIPLHEVLAGLLAGNAVILKVATQAQAVGDAIARMFAESGLPEHLLHVLHLPGRIAGDALLDAGVGKLFFTGSTEVGRELARKAGERLVPVSLELGGNDPMIVREDADVARAASCAVWAGLSNAGQSCGAVERIYVADAVYDRFLAQLRDEVEALRPGYDDAFQVDLGSLTTEDQLQTVKRQLGESLSDGGREVARSASAGGGRFHPAVVVEVSDDEGAIVREETFGPVLAVRRVSGDDEALRLANDSRYGLTASVWTSDREAADRLAHALEAGAVTVNDHLLSHGMPETPWGGWKESGIGRSHSRLGFEEMTQPKVVIEERFAWIRRNMWWPPYSREVYDGLAGALVARYGRGLRRRLAGSRRAVRLFVRRARGR